jgi:hypothetical protein
MNSTKALYLYCFTPAGKVDTTQLVGLDEDYPVIGYPHGDIMAITSQVPLDEFVGQAAEERLRDIAWITPRACRHQAVIAQIENQTALFPLPFGTIFSTEQVLSNLIRQHQAQIHGFMESIKGYREWSCKVFLDRDQAMAKLATEALVAEAQRLQMLSPGARYFEERKIKTAAAKQINQWLHTVLEDLMRELAAETGRHCHRALLSRKATGSVSDMVLNGAFLVAEKSLQTFFDKVDHCKQTYGQTGLTFELSGPWPPYSFCPPLQNGQG